MYEFLAIASGAIVVMIAACTVSLFYLLYALAVVLKSQRKHK